MRSSIHVFVHLDNPFKYVYSENPFKFVHLDYPFKFLHLDNPFKFVHLDNPSNMYMFVNYGFGETLHILAVVLVFKVKIK